MDDRGRIVVVAAGFALWLGGRCVAAARWSDIRRLRARRSRAQSAGALSLTVELADGSSMELHEEAPGFAAFLDRASAVLQGLMPYRDWHGQLDTLGDDGVAVFERPAGRY